MSTILEALRKSERARRRRQAPVYRDASTSETPVLLRWLTLAAGVALIVALGFSVWLMNRSPSDLASTNAAHVPTGEALTGQSDKSVPESAPRASAAPVPAAKPLSEQKLPDSRNTTKDAMADRDGDPSKPVAVTSDEVPWLSSLPESFRNRLPKLVVNIHVFSPDEAQRILYINNRPYKRGEQIPGGVVVEEIVPEGVILRAQGQRFKLPRPT